MVATLGNRQEYLTQCLESIRDAGQAFTLIVAPQGFNSKILIEKGLVNASVLDPGQGLPAAINAGVANLPREVEFINWLGDDDLLTRDSLTQAEAVLNGDPKIAMVFGSCDYINSSGDLVWKNKSGNWAVPLMRVGPDLVPQPGALFRRSEFERVGGLDTQYNWAFDYDLFLKFSKKAQLKFLNQTLAKFRWHPESLSVEHRKSSVCEASAVRVSHLPIGIRILSPLWELPIRAATLVAGKWVSKLAKKTSAAR